MSEDEKQDGCIHRWGGPICAWCEQLQADNLQLDRWRHWTPEHNIEQWLRVVQKELADLRASNIHNEFNKSAIEKLRIEKEALRGENAGLYGELQETRRTATETLDMLEIVNHMWERSREALYKKT